MGRLKRVVSRGGSAQAGWSYIVSVDGTVDGVAFKENDRVIAITDNASTSTYAANWFHADYTDVYQTDAEIETAYNNQVGIVSQAAAEAGTSTTAERWTPQRVAQAIAALETKPAATTGTVLSLTNPSGILYNMSSANSATTYTTTGTTLNAYAKVLINAASEPTVTGGTKIAGSDFSAATNMYLWVTYNGNRVEFWFEEI